MKIVIEIDDDDYQFIKDTEFENYAVTKHLYEAVYEGTPLPKGHGDLIDRNECLKLKMTDLYDKDGVTMYAVPTGNILRMKPIIEAESEEEHKTH